MNQVQQFFEYILNIVKVWVIVQPWETGLRVRNGKKIKKLYPGLYFRLPYFDSVYIQEKRLRIISLPIQTVTTKDLQTVTLNGAVGYAITDIKTLYQTLFHPETTITNVVMNEISKFVINNTIKDAPPEKIENSVLGELKNGYDYGIEFQYFKITNFAVIRTYRLIQDQSWVNEDLKMGDKK